MLVSYALLVILATNIWPNVRREKPLIIDGVDSTRSCQIPLVAMVAWRVSRKGKLAILKRTPSINDFHSIPLHHALLK
jgi:hypothetical protein